MLTQAPDPAPLPSIYPHALIKSNVIIIFRAVMAQLISSHEREDNESFCSTYDSGTVADGIAHKKPEPALRALQLSVQDDYAIGYQARTAP